MQKFNTEISRRRFLKLLGIGAGGVATTALGLNYLNHRNYLKNNNFITGKQTGSVGSGPVTVEGIEFDRVLNAVDDLGMDPNNGEPIHSEMESAVESGTLIEFPPGEYRIGGEISRISDDFERFGIRGMGSSRRDVKFTTPNDGSHPGVPFWLEFQGEQSGGPYLLKNFSLQQPYDNSTSIGILLRNPGDTVVKNLEWLGRTPDGRGATDGFTPLTVDATSADGVSLVENIAVGIDAPAIREIYPGGNQFLRQGGSHAGEVIINKCHFERHGSNVTRSTVNDGVVTIKNCFFKDNWNVCGIRMGPGEHPSKVSTAKNCRIVMHSDEEYISDGIRLDAAVSGSDETLGGCELYNIEIIAEEDSFRRGAITTMNSGHYLDAYFKNIVVKNNCENPTIEARYPEDPTDGKNTAWVFEDSHFTGSGGNLHAHGREGSVLRNCCVDMPNAEIIDFKTVNVSKSGCKTPEDVEMIGSGGPRETGGTQKEIDTITFQSTAQKPQNYFINTTDNIERANSSNVTDSIYGTKATGTIKPNGKITYNIKGRITNLQTDKGTQIKINGKEKTKSQILENYLTCIN